MMNPSEFRGFITMQSQIDIYEDYAVKKYIGDWAFNSVDHEIDKIRAFKSIHGFEVEKLSRNSYKMPVYRGSLGNSCEIIPERFRRILFTLSSEDICNQLDHILIDLKANNLQYNDINPGNILFDSKNKLLKLCDFFWCDKENLEPDPNKNYGVDDAKAIDYLKREVRAMAQIIKVEAEQAKHKFINSVGKIYNDGSFVAPGIAYHPIDIPGFEDVQYFHKNCASEYQVIKLHIPKDIKHVVDIGCNCGYNTFNLIRDFNLWSATVYETDPAVLELLTSIKEIYELNLLKIEGRFDGYKFPVSDVTLFMNSYQWINKELGKDLALEILKDVIAKSKLTFFQASGVESHGTAIVDYFENKDQIAKLLEDLGGQVEFLGSTTAHGGLRHLYKIVGGNKKVESLSIGEQASLGLASLLPAICWGNLIDLADFVL